MKKGLIIIALSLLVGYLIFAFFFFKKKPQDQICSYFRIETKNTEDDRFVNITQLEKYIDSKNLNPYGKQLKDVNTLAIQNVILENHQIKTAEVFTTNDGGIRAVITERKPLFRVISSIEGSYYVDVDGKKMPLSTSNTAYLPVVTGSVKEAFATTDLYKFILFLSSNSFWNAQIEQIIVDSNDEVSLITRVGDHQVILGSLDKFEEKLDNLKIFYSKALPSTGWNRYKILNLKYNNQVVGTKR